MTGGKVENGCEIAALKKRFDERVPKPRPVRFGQSEIRAIGRPRLAGVRGQGG